MDVMTYDVRKVNASAAGRILTGYADSVATVTRNSDMTTPSAGCKGDITYSENADESGNIALTFMSTSSSLPYLRDLCLRRKEFTFSITDANDHDAIKVSENRCRILKMPDIPRGKEQTPVTVNIYAPKLDIR